jgi:hypothetical protein
MALYCRYKTDRRHYLHTGKKLDLYPNDRHKRRGKALCTMDDVFKEAEAIRPS